MFDIKRYELNMGDNAAPMVFETGHKARQANGSIWVTQGDTAVLVTAVSRSKSPADYMDFFPMTVNYLEKFYAAGKIPGGFIKRETKPSERETLTSRLIDRPLRPLFPSGFKNETQIIATVMSYDEEYMTDILALNAASMALIISDIPFNNPVGSVRIGRKDGGNFIVNPPFDSFDELDLNIILSGTQDALVMVEGGMDFLTEDVILEALEFGHERIKEVIALQLQAKNEIGKPDMAYEDFSLDGDLLDKFETQLSPAILKALSLPTKLEKYEAIAEVSAEFLAKRKEELPEGEYVESMEKDYFKEVEKRVFRRSVLESKVRFDGRALDEVRPIHIENRVLPRAHGSSLFTRGETQAMVAITLAATESNQMADEMVGFKNNYYFLHYNFPPYSVGEVGRMGPPGRREVGHSSLAERALVRSLPNHDDFPYTIRVVSEILESNGSSSMASVCGGSLALMDAGVPMKAPISGIAMGLIHETDDNGNSNYVVLSDIMGLEDHLGDMDFKVAGSKDGITALQMDIKVDGLSRSILEEALRQAYAGRMHILDKMNATLEQPQEALSSHAPRYAMVTISSEKIGALIGPQGKNIKAIVADTGASVNIGEEGVVSIFAKDEAVLDEVKKYIARFTDEVEVGKTYDATVKKIMEYGAFVELIPSTEALLHISQVANERVENIREYLNEGDTVRVKVMGKDRNGRFEISHKVLIGDDNE